MRRQEIDARNAINHAMATSAHRISSVDDDVEVRWILVSLSYSPMQFLTKKPAAPVAPASISWRQHPSFLPTPLLLFGRAGKSNGASIYYYYTPSMLTQRCHNPHPCQNHCGDLRGDLLHKFLSNFRRPAPSSSLQHYDQQKQQL